MRSFRWVVSHTAALSRWHGNLLLEEELQQWLSQDPETITVEEIQSLPHAIEVADHCR